MRFPWPFIGDQTSCVAARRFARAPDIPRRAILAIGLGCAIALSGVVYFGPTMRGVIAEEMDQRQIYTMLLNRERAQPRAATAPTRVAREPVASSRGVRALFNLDNRASNGGLPDGARAYAPLPSGPLTVGPTRASFEGASRVRRASAAPRVAALSQRSVCVRLCDGMAFPIADYAGESDNAAHSAVCSGMCPGAPTRLYVAPAGSDKLEDAVSANDRKPYSALPVAFRYLTTRDDTCSCHAPGASSAAHVSLMRDFTLRHGDKIMTPKGFRVYRGASAWLHSKGDFSPLGQAGLDRRELGVFRAMERASLAGDRFAGFTPVTPTPPYGPTRANAAENLRGPMRKIGPQVFLEGKMSRVAALP